MEHYQKGAADMGRRIYRRVRVYQTPRDKIMGTDNYWWDYRRDQQAEADAAARARQVARLAREFSAMDRHIRDIAG